MRPLSVTRRTRRTIFIMGLLSAPGRSAERSARAINSGSPFKFHKVFREEAASGRVTFVGHQELPASCDPTGARRPLSCLIAEIRLMPCKGTGGSLRSYLPILVRVHQRTDSRMRKSERRPEATRMGLWFAWPLKSSRGWAMSGRRQKADRPSDHIAPTTITSTMSIPVKVAFGCA